MELAGREFKCLYEFAQVFKENMSKIRSERKEPNSRYEKYIFY